MDLSILQNPHNIPSPNFPQFDVVSLIGDHHFATTPPPDVAGTGTTLHKKIMKEWRILEHNLPNSIFVRVYEQRIDLLRAVIVGAPGTPYHDGLFFFDVAFPANYPDSPPKVLYKSFGMRVNPNLYDTGHVCLSLLNTWHGPHWEANRSTILQVLISLQGLVLNENPIFNEPGVPNWRLLKNMSRDYNEDVFMHSCKTMRLLLRNPPTNFDSFVVQHFRSRARAILTASRFYSEGFVRVGEYNGDGVFLSKRVRVSRKLLEFMNGEYLLLERALKTNDSSLNGFLVEMDKVVEKIRADYIDEEEAKRLIRKYNKVMNKLGDFLRTCLG